MPKGSHLGRALITGAVCLGSILATLLSGAAPANAVVSSTPLASTWGTNGTVNALAQLGGRVYLGGSFGFLGPRTGSAVTFDESKAGYAGGAPSLESGFPVVNGTIDAAIADGSGGWYVGGSFTTIGGVDQPNLAHVEANGAVDTAFAPSVHGTIDTLLLSGGSLYVGGSFSGISGGDASGVARLDLPSGTYDSGWQHGSEVGVDGQVSALAIHGSDLYVGGSFLFLLNGDGSSTSVTDLVGLDTTHGLSDGFTPAFDTSGQGALSLATTTVGTTPELLVGGDFQTPETNLVVYSLASTPAQLGAGVSAYPNGPVDSIITDATGDVWIGGSFADVGASARAGLAKYELPTLDAHWYPAVNGSVSALAHVGSDIVVGGAFSSLTAATTLLTIPALRSNIGAVADADGASPNYVPVRAFNPGTSAGVNALAAAAGTTVLAGGGFELADGLSRQNLAAIDTATGEGDTGVAANTDDEVWALATSGSRLYAGGQFSNVDGHPSPGLAELDPGTGQLASGFVPPLSGGVIDALSFSSDGTTVYAGGPGLVTNSGTVHLGAFDATTGAFKPSAAPDANKPVVRLLTSGDTVYVGGHFTQLGGVTRAALGAFSSSTGQLDTAFDPSVAAGPPTNGLAVSSLAQSGSLLYIGGSFGLVGGASHPNLAAVNPTSGAVDSGWFANVDDPVIRLAVLGSHLYAAGPFGYAGASAPRNGFAAFNLSNGGLSDWNPQLLAVTDGHALLPVGNTLYVGYAGSSSVGPHIRFGAADRTGDLRSRVASSGDGVPPPPYFAAFTFTAPSAASPAAAVAGYPWPGQRLACTIGGFSGGPESYTFAWLRDGAAISAQTGQTYTVASGDLGHRIACRATAVNPAGSASETSATVAITRRPGGPAMHISTRAVTAATSGKFSVKLTCPRGFTLCTGTLSLASSGKVGGKTLSLGSARFTLHGARSAGATFKLPRGDLSLLKKHHSIRCLATATAHDASSRYATATARFTLKAPKPKPKKHHKHKP